MRSETMEDRLLGSLVNTKNIHGNTISVAGSFYHFLPTGFVKNPTAGLMRYRLAKITGVYNGKLVLSPVSESKEK